MEMDTTVTPIAVQAAQFYRRGGSVRVTSHPAAQAGVTNRQESV